MGSFEVDRVNGGGAGGSGGAVVAASRCAVRTGRRTPRSGINV